jgi:hypothetical protein
MPVASAFAANCSDGGLVFLGKTSDLSVSVWASRTGAGSFALEAPGNTVVDTWNKQRRGIHISRSPVVSPGNGSPHSLIDTAAGCTMVNNVNQKGGITFPPGFQLPPKLPPFLRPPGSRPPSGLMPTLPGGVTPPIGTLPPTGAMPTVPGGVTPPIGTLPPTGLMPTLPPAPPGGVMPTVPGGVTPPIGTLPPTGLMPTVPGGVTPPIGTLPPTGVMPTVPGGVTPPIGTLPPTGVMPTVPPGGGTTGAISGELIPGTATPFTEGRRFAFAPDWNIWVDTNGIRTSDHRYGLDTTAKTGHVTIGADYRVKEALVVGMTVMYEQSSVSGYGDGLEVRSDGISVGPYFAYRFSPNWTMDGSLNYGQIGNDERIEVLNSSYTTQRTALSLGATGDYSWGETKLYPRVTLSYTQFRSEGHDLSGVVGGLPLSVRVSENSIDYGVAEANVEITRGFSAAGAWWYPFAEFGVRYEFERPNDGMILTGNLTLEEVSPWAGTLRLGLRTLVSRQAFIEASLGYLSVGQKDLDVVEGRLFLSFAF